MILMVYIPIIKCPKQFTLNYFETYEEKMNIFLKISCKEMIKGLKELKEKGD